MFFNFVKHSTCVANVRCGGGGGEKCLTQVLLVIKHNFLKERLVMGVI